MSKKYYDLIIVGAGSVGAALALEMDLHGLKTLVIEKGERQVEKVPRVVSLSARSMEFLRRWRIDQMLQDNLPRFDAHLAIWCSALCGELFYADLWGDNRLPQGTSAQEGVRAPLWIVEQTLRDRIEQLDTIDLVYAHEVTNVISGDDDSPMEVVASNLKNGEVDSYYAPYVACCDGASGLSHTWLGNGIKRLSKKMRMLCVNFLSKEIDAIQTVPKGVMYAISSSTMQAFMGPTDVDQGQWMIHFPWPDKAIEPNHERLSAYIDKAVGKPIAKTIQETTYWGMQASLIDFCSWNDRVFWLGDAAHPMPPTGGLGINTGLGDAQNLGWKLAEVIHQKAAVSLLATYGEERLPIWQTNLAFSMQNAKDFNALSKEANPKEALLARADLAKQFFSSSGLTMGYRYSSALIEVFSKPGGQDDFDPATYQPKEQPGYFLPHKWLGKVSIYDRLSATCWHVIVAEDVLSSAAFSHASIRCLSVPKGLYAHPYILIRPDWHIARVGACLQEILCAFDARPL